MFQTMVPEVREQLLSNCWTSVDFTSINLHCRKIFQRHTAAINWLRTSEVSLYNVNIWVLLSFVTSTNKRT